MHEEIVLQKQRHKEVFKRYQSEMKGSIQPHDVENLHWEVNKLFKIINIE